MDRRLQLQNYSFVLLEQIVIFAVLVDTIPRIFLSQKSYGEKYLINQNLLSTFWENIYQKQLLFT